MGHIFGYLGNELSRPLLTLPLTRVWETPLWFLYTRSLLGVPYLSGLIMLDDNLLSVCLVFTRRSLGSTVVVGK